MSNMLPPLWKQVLKFLFKSGPVAADTLLVSDSEANGFLKRITVANFLGSPAAAAATAPSVLTAAATITAAQAYSGIAVTNVGASGAVTYVLPAALPGMRVKALVKAVQELRLDPNTTQTIALPSTGVQGAAGKYLTADAIGESVELICTVAGTWDSFGAVDGTWTAEP